MRYRATRRLSDQTRIFGERAGPVSRRPRLPRLSPRHEFLIVDHQIHAAGAGIDSDPIAFAHQRQWATHE